LRVAQEEMEIWAALPPHPNVVRVYHAQTAKPPFLLMELCSQGRLYDALRGKVRALAG
jgi:hypothetical protein